jgi:hypothetical protein
METPYNDTDFTKLGYLSADLSCLTVRTHTIGAGDAIRPGLNGVEKCERCRAAKQKVYQLFVINSSATSFIGVKTAPVAQS